MTSKKLKFAIGEKIKRAIYEQAKKLWPALTLKLEQVEIERPKERKFGDYSTNFAMRFAGQIGTDPETIASKFKILTTQLKEVGKVDFIKPGFINFYLSNEFLLAELKQINRLKNRFGQNTLGQGEKIVLEHTSPNIIKKLHIGHLRNNVLAMALARILTACGYKVYKDCINNDRGIHICKALWDYLIYGQKEKPKEILGLWQQKLDQWIKAPNLWLKPEDKKQKPDHFVDDFYVTGVRAEADNPKVHQEMQAILQAWEAKDKKVWKLWKVITSWVYQGFSQTYKRIGSQHDQNWYESQLYEEGKKLALAAVKKGIFRQLKDGAILTNLAKYKLPDTIVIRADGTALYLTFDPNLTQHKRKKFKADKYLYCIGPEQSLYLKQLFAVCEQLGIGQQEDYCHLSYGYLYLRGEGKMSSRAGNVIGIDEFCDQMKTKAEEILLQSEEKLSKPEIKQRAEIIARAAIKYYLLKYDRQSDIQFDIDEALALEGDSGPYLLYSYARLKSILAKAKKSDLGQKLTISELKPEERNLLRLLRIFPEVVPEAAGQYDPQAVADYLYQLASQINTFYHQLPVLKAPTEQRVFRLNLILGASIILNTGLKLLGIETLERM